MIASKKHVIHLFWSLILLEHFSKVHYVVVLQWLARFIATNAQIVAQEAKSFAFVFCEQDGRVQRRVSC
jgi:hypothetical protein